MGSEAFFLPDAADTYLPTEHTEGPWDPRFQHGGPPGALLVREIERLVGDENLLLARITGEILGPLPREPLRIRSWVDRPGRRVRLVCAELSHQGRPVMVTRAWAVRPVPVDLPAVPPAEPAPPPAGSPPPAGPETARPWDPPPGTSWECGFLAATEWRFVQGGYGQLGPAVAWVRPRMPLLPGESMSPAQRVVFAADSANGISAVLDLGRWLFIPPELTVHIGRPPTGEWLRLAATTSLPPGGTGLTVAELSDRLGPVARSAQSLLVEPVRGG